MIKEKRRDEIIQIEQIPSMPALYVNFFIAKNMSDVSLLHDNTSACKSCKQKDD